MRRRVAGNVGIRQWLADDWRATGERWQEGLGLESNPFHRMLEDLDAGRPVVVRGWQISAYPGVSVSPYEEIRVEPDATLTRVRGVDFVGAHWVDGRRLTGIHLVGWVPVGSSAPERVSLDELGEWVDDPESYEEIPRWEALRSSPAAGRV